MDHFNAAVEEGQTLRDLKRTQNRAVGMTGSFIRFSEKREYFSVLQL